jgi:hypothetical protein
MTTNNDPTLSIRKWLRAMGSSITELRRYSVKRTRLRRAVRDAIYQRNSAPLHVHLKGTSNGSRKQP